jgi:gliding motility-associated-like protein
VAAAAYNSVPAILSTGYVGPTGVAADAAGNLYIADYGNKQVKKIISGSSTAIILGFGFTNPFGVAVDAAGDVYVADYGASAVYKIPAGNGTPVTIGSGFSHPTGVALDAAGNLYIADHSNNAVKKILAGTNTPIKIGGGFVNPVGIAVDAAGNVYVGDRDNNAVKEIPAHNDSPVTIGSGFSSPYGIAVDASGNVFVADYGNNAVKEIPAGTSTPATIATGFKNPEGVAADGAGNIYVADQGTNAIKQIKPIGGYYIGPFLPAGLTLSNTTGVISGTPTVASPATNYTITAYNAFGSITANLTINVLNANANLSNLVLSSGPLTPVFSAGTTGYTASVANSVTLVTVTPTTSDPNATVTVNNVAVTSGTPATVQLNVGDNVITTVVTAQNGTTKKTYTLSVTRAPGSDDSYQQVSVANPTNTVGLEDDGIMVHQGVSPNGDGINDFLQIDNISQYPDNKLSIMNRNGQLVYEASGYNNSTKTFDGHSNKNGQMQLPGTYFYQLAYTVKGIVKYKTGFLVLKY